jgi:sugar phosphate isomerase/epimerase
MKYDPRIHPVPPDDFLWKDKSGDYVCCPLGEGAVNIENLLKALSAGGYDGYICLEPHVPPDILVETFRDALEYVKAHQPKSHEWTEK